MSRDAPLAAPFAAVQLAALDRAAARAQAAMIGEIAADMLRIVNQSTACFGGLVAGADPMQ